MNVGAEPSNDSDLDEVAAVEDGEETESVQSPKAKRERNYSKKVMTDVDLESTVSFPDFAASKTPATVRDKYLIAAAWYNLHRATPAITMHHVYTCFLHPRVKWSTSASDFDQPLRDLVKANRMGRGERGYYVINTIGLADVVALGND